MKNATIGMVLLLAMSGGALAQPPQCAMPPASANEQTFAESANVCRANAEQGDAKSQYVLGLMYQHGKGVRQDYTEALRWYRKAADQDDAKAQYGLGYMYDLGQGLPHDFAEAIRWYRKAADQGNAQAQCGLGSIYYDGRGIQQDRAAAARWYRQAADRGFARAQYDLGYMYYYGQGVPQDRNEANHWFRKAADQGDESAQRILGLRGTGLSTLGKINTSLGFFGSLILAISFLLPGQDLRNRQQQATTLTGLLGLSFVGVVLYRHSPSVLLHSVLVANTLAFTQSLLAGTFIAMVMAVLWPKSAKVALGIFGTLLAAFNLLQLVTAYQDPRRLAGVRACYTANGFLVGVSITLAFFSWLRSRKRADDAIVSR